MSTEKLKFDKIIIKYLKKWGIIRDTSILYIGGNEILPPPLTPQEENEIIQKIKNGIDTDNMRKKLVERNLRLVVYIAKKYEKSVVGIEDIISIGTIGLMKAINTFNPDKNIKLATYASRCIENEILMFLRRNNRIKTEVSIDEPLNTDSDGNEMVLSDILGGEDDSVSKDLENEVDLKLLQEAIVKLEPREKYIMELRFGFKTGEEKTQKDVADMLNISQSYISRLEKKIIKRLKKDITAKI